MNGKKAKALRRQARAEADGMPEVGHAKLASTERVKRYKFPSKQIVDGTILDGEPPEQIIAIESDGSETVAVENESLIQVVKPIMARIDVKVATIVNHPQTQRAAYRRMKAK